MFLKFMKSRERWEANLKVSPQDVCIGKIFNIAWSASISVEEKVFYIVLI